MEKVAINMVASDFVPMKKRGEIIKVQAGLVELAIRQGAEEIAPDEDGLVWISEADAIRLGFE